MPPNRWHDAKSVLVVFVHGYSMCIEAVGMGCLPRRVAVRRVGVEVHDSTAQAIRVLRTDRGVGATGRKGKFRG